MPRRRMKLGAPIALSLLWVMGCIDSSAEDPILSDDAEPVPLVDAHLPSDSTTSSHADTAPGERADAVADARGPTALMPSPPMRSLTGTSAACAHPDFRT